MSSKAWKRHELKTAKYFGTKRRLRGADFSQSDVEVLVDLGEWLPDRYSPKEAFLVVECKYRQRLGVVSTFRKYATTTIQLPMLRIGEYILCSLDDFEPIFNDFISTKNDTTERIEILEKYSILSTNIKAPKYLEDFRTQAMEYIPNLAGGNPGLPIVCLAKSGGKGRVLSIHLDDIKDFRLLT